MTEDRAALIALYDCTDPRCALCGACLRILQLRLAPSLAVTVPAVVADDDPIRSTGTTAGRASFWRGPGRPRTRKGLT